MNQNPTLMYQHFTECKKDTLDCIALLQQMDLPPDAQKILADLQNDATELVDSGENLLLHVIQKHEMMTEKLKETRKKCQKAKLKKKDRLDKAILGDFASQTEKLLSVYLTGLPSYKISVLTDRESYTDRRYRKRAKVLGICGARRNEIRRAIADLKDARFSQAHPAISRSKEISEEEIEEISERLGQQSQVNVLLEIWRMLLKAGDTFDIGTWEYAEITK